MTFSKNYFSAGNYSGTFDEPEPAKTLTEFLGECGYSDETICRVESRQNQGCFRGRDISDIISLAEEIERELIRQLRDEFCHSAAIKLIDASRLLIASRSAQ